MSRWKLCCLAVVALCLGVGCEKPPPPVKIGASMCIGGAARWATEMHHMEERAKELGVNFEGRLRVSGTAQEQFADCCELIDSGVSVLILTPRDVNSVEDILDYAKRKDVKVISYARAVMGESVDLFVGFDSYKIGLSMGEYLADRVPAGDIIVLRGDEKDFNTSLIYHGGMKLLKPLIAKGDMRVIFDGYVRNWLPEEAKPLVLKALKANGNRVDGIFASNDRMAGAAVEALQELGITAKVVVTGMDAELAAAKRLVAGTQDFTVFMDLRTLARTAMDEAYSLATQKKASINSVMDTQSLSKIGAYLINGKPVTRETLDALLIETGVFSREEVYGR